MKVICFSLWGNNPKYNLGAIQNAYLVKKHYPRWMARFYVHEKTDGVVISELKSSGAQTILMREESNWNAAFWRFNAVKDKSVEVMISRDTDSRIYEREVDAVEAWLRSPANLHIMRDHPYHSDLILGGMWGAKRPLFEFISSEMDAFLRASTKAPEYGIDQEFLRRVYGKYRLQALVHDEFFEGMRFPAPRKELRFVGQVYGEDEKTPADHLAALKYATAYQQNLRRYSILEREAQSLLPSQA